LVLQSIVQNKLTHTFFKIDTLIEKKELELIGLSGAAEGQTLKLVAK
jgi:hypothetical protein